MRDEVNYPKQLYIHPVDTEQSLLKDYHRENRDVLFFVKRSASALHKLDVVYIKDHDAVETITLDLKNEDEERPSLPKLAIQALREKNVFSADTTDEQVLLDHQAIIDTENTTTLQRTQSPHRAGLFRLEEGMGERQNAFCLDLPTPPHH